MVSGKQHGGRDPEPADLVALMDVAMFTADVAVTENWHLTPAAQTRIAVESAIRQLACLGLIEIPTNVIERADEAMANGVPARAWEHP